MAYASWNYGRVERCKQVSAEGKGAIYLEEDGDSYHLRGHDSPQGFPINIDEIDSLIEQLQNLKIEWNNHKEEQV